MTGRGMDIIYLFFFCLFPFYPPLILSIMILFPNSLSSWILRSNPRVARKEAVSFFFPLSVSKFSGSQEDMLFGSDGDDGDFGRRNNFQGGSNDDDSDDEDCKK